MFTKGITVSLPLKQNQALYPSLCHYQLTGTSSEGSNLARLPSPTIGMTVMCRYFCLWMNKEINETKTWKKNLQLLECLRTLFGCMALLGRRYFASRWRILTKITLKVISLHLSTFHTFVTMSILPFHREISTISFKFLSTSNVVKEKIMERVCCFLLFFLFTPILHLF